MAKSKKSTPPTGLKAEDVIRLETWMPEIASKRLGPIHDDVNGGYRVGDSRALAIHKRGTFHDFRDGFTGRGGIALIMHLDRCDQAAAVKVAQRWLSDHAGQGRLRPATDEGVDEEAAEDDVARTAMIKGIWERAQPIKGTPAEKYLKSRGLTPAEGDMEQLHWLPNMRGDEGAMFAALTGKDGNLVAFQETYLTDAGHKSPHPPVRNTTRGPHDWNRTGFVRFGKRNSASIAICEGVEDALSAIEGGTEAAFALTGIARLGRVLVPLGVSKVIVVRDADDQDSPADIALWRGLTRMFGHGIRDTLVTSRPADLAAEGAAPVKDINDLLRHDAGLVRELLVTAAMPLPSSLSPTAIEAITDEMSRLDTNGYERGREKIARLLGWRVSALDKARRKRIAERVSANEQGEPLDEEVPWEEPITDIGAVLDEAVKEMRRYIVAPDHLFHTTALWALFAHVLHREDLPIKCAPRLAIQSPTTVCGKSTLLEIIACTTPRANITGSTTPASIFREIHAVKPTLLIDEADNLFGDRSNELLAIANSGHRRRTAFVTRTERDEKGKFFVTRFSTWTGIAYAGIRELPETQQNRSIVVSLQRATPEDAYEHLVDSESAILLDANRKFARFANDLRELPRIDRPKSLSNRLGDNWYPLRQLAHIAGGEWPQRALDAALGVGDDPAEQNQTLALLEAVWQVFHATQLHRISSRELVDRLLDMDEGRWREAHFGKDITPHYLSRQLRGMILNTPAAKTARQWRDNSQAVIRGYSELHFEDAWLRYLGKASPKKAGSAAEDSGTGQDTTTDAPGGESQADDSTRTQEGIYSATSATSATGTKNAEESAIHPVGGAKERSATDINEQNHGHDGNAGDVADGKSPFARAYPKGARPRGPRRPKPDGEGDVQ